jgi:hypothetical protein
MRVLFTGKSIVDPWSKDLCRVKFPKTLDSASYKVYGAVYEKEKNLKDVKIKLGSSNIYEFSFEVEWPEYP